MAAVFTPKQVAVALGVSESSVKRWVDSGRLPAARTAGGHRKVSLPAIAGFVRETGQQLSRPELLGMVALDGRTPAAKTERALFDAIAAGEEATARNLILSFYQGGESLVDLADRLVGPAMRRIGDGWADGDVQVHQERRACEIVAATLHELTGWLPAPEADAPLAVVATPSLDFSEVAVRLLDLVLRGEGWRVVTVGSGLPLAEIRDAVLLRRPRLVCVSVSHLDRPAAEFAEAYNRELVEPTVDAVGPVSHALGGGALPDEVGPAARCDVFGHDVAGLVEFARSIR